jgi:hypothetical protein
MRAPQVNDTDARARRQKARRGRGTQGILLLAQMADDEDLEAAQQSRLPRQRRRRLVDDDELAAVLARDRLGHEIMKPDQRVGQIEGTERRRGVARRIAIDVRASERHDERRVRLPRAKATDRGCAPPGMKGDHEIGGLITVIPRHAHLVAELADETRPAPRRHPVAGARLFRCGRDEANLHPTV